MIGWRALTILPATAMPARAPNWSTRFYLKPAETAAEYVTRLFRREVREDHERTWFSSLVRFS
jgi:hypothetical protein